MASRFLIKLLSSTLSLISFASNFLLLLLLPLDPRRDKVSEPLPSGSFIGSLKAGFVTERSELGSCRAFSEVDAPNAMLVILFIGIHVKYMLV